MAPSRDPEPLGLDPWLLERYRSDYAHLVRLAALLVDDTGSAEEVVQDAFVSVARALAGGRLRETDRTTAYLRSAVLNGARSQLRRRRVRRRYLRSVGPPPTSPPADGPAISAETSARVAAALDQLSSRQREVLVLRYYADLSEAEIAETLDISPGSVKTHAHRGLASLERLLERP